MEAEIRSARRTAYGVMGAAVVLSAPVVGWTPLVPLLVCVVATYGSTAIVARGLGAPRVVLLATSTLALAMLTLMAAASGGAQSPLLAWPAILVASVAVRLDSRDLAVMTVTACVSPIAAATLVDPGGLAHDPSGVLGACAVIIAVAAYTGTIMRAEVRHRGEARTDPLTGLLNRKGLEARAEALARGRDGIVTPIAVIAGDVDNFKWVNDQHGHDAGDALLCQVAELLQRNVRSQDLVVRLGGDEFLIVLPGTSANQVTLLGERLIDLARQELPHPGRVGISMGAAGAMTPVDFAGLWKRADEALYAAKRRGRGRLVVAPDAEPLRPHIAQPVHPGHQ